MKQDRFEQRVAGILLAAGRSTRMGRTKQLLTIKGKPLLGMVLEEALRSQLDKVVLVLGHEAAEIKRALGKTLFHAKLKVIVNRNFEQGISSSIIAGLSEVESEYGHVMIILADIPDITREIINSLLRRYLTSGFSIGAIYAKGNLCHPVIFSQRWYDALHRLKGDVGGRELLREYPDEICLVAPGVPYEGRDIDTPGDYSEFQ